MIKALLILLVFLSGQGRGQFVDRTEMQEHYKDYLASGNNILLGGAPLYHITPQKQTITFAGGIDWINTTIAPDGYSIIEGPGDDLDHSLTTTGWSASPLITISTKNFGFGFASENGMKRVHYLWQPEGYGGYTETQSDLTYSGFGLFLYYIPSFKVFPKWVIPTVIGGSKIISAEHTFHTPKYSESSPDETEKYRYQVRKIHLGANLGIQIAKKFTIIPWFDYTMVKIGDAESDNSRAPDLASSADASPPPQSPFANVFQADQELFWQLAPSRTYGIDFAVEIWRLDIHLGGALGALASTSEGSDRIYDSNYSLSISYSMKAR